MEKIIIKTVCFVKYTTTINVQLFCHLSEAFWNWMWQEKRRETVGAARSYGTIICFILIFDSNKTIIVRNELQKTTDHKLIRKAFTQVSIQRSQRVIFSQTSIELHVFLQRVYPSKDGLSIFYVQSVVPLVPLHLCCITFVFVVKNL